MSISINSLRASIFDRENKSDIDFNNGINDKRCEKLRQNRSIEINRKFVSTRMGSGKNTAGSKRKKSMPTPSDSIPDFDPMQLVAEYQSTVLKLAKTDDTGLRKQLEVEAQELRSAWESMKGLDNIHSLAFGDTIDL